MDEFVQNSQGLGVLCLLAFRLVCLAVAYVRLRFVKFSRGESRLSYRLRLKMIWRLRKLM